jgi:hypothetical protein
MESPQIDGRFVAVFNNSFQRRREYFSGILTLQKVKKVRKGFRNHQSFRFPNFALRKIIQFPLIFHSASAICFHFYVSSRLVTVAGKIVD